MPALRCLALLLRLRLVRLVDRLPDLILEYGVRLGGTLPVLVASAALGDPESCCKRVQILPALRVQLLPRQPSRLLGEIGVCVLPFLAVRGLFRVLRGLNIRQELSAVLVPTSSRLDDGDAELLCEVT